YWEMAGYYVGALTLALMLVGLLRKKRELWALFVVSLVGILLAFGEKTPLHKFFFDHVPLFGTLRAPTRALVILVFAAPLVAAEGAQHMTAHFKVGRIRSLIFALIAVASLVGIYFARHPGLAAAEQAGQRAMIHLHLVFAGTFLVLALWKFRWAPFLL